MHQLAVNVLAKTLRFEDVLLQLPYIAATHNSSLLLLSSSFLRDLSAKYEVGQTDPVAVAKFFRACPCNTAGRRWSSLELCFCVRFASLKAGVISFRSVC